MLPSLANSGNSLESIYLAAVAAAVDEVCPVKWTQSPVKKRMRDALGELHPCQIEDRHRCWPEKQKKFVNMMFITRPAQFFFGKMPQTPQWNLAQTVTGDQFSANSEVV